MKWYRSVNEVERPHQLGIDRAAMIPTLPIRQPAAGLLQLVRNSDGRAARARRNQRLSILQLTEPAENVRVCNGTAQRVPTLPPPSTPCSISANEYIWHLFSHRDVADVCVRTTTEVRSRIRWCRKENGRPGLLCYQATISFSYCRTLLVRGFVPNGRPLPCPRSLHSFADSAEA